MQACWPGTPTLKPENVALRTGDSLTGGKAMLRKRRAHRPNRAHIKQDGAYDTNGNARSGPYNKPVCGHVEQLPEAGVWRSPETFDPWTGKSSTSSSFV